ncbi:hypothetical protein FJT64_023478 [Amphibalanus amphitrite]|uniref:Uncharacterized protein n=1 Tax=Amphibalanus amphitrite TaxID=1232801 RepID=A0A6A4WRP5_AMPAM|nr:hypothetical protein FJT64_023478 [Amphibalanus amphitrite]
MEEEVGLRNSVGTADEDGMRPVSMHHQPPSMDRAVDRSFLTGDAREAVRGLLCDMSLYEVALSELETQFGNPTAVVQSTLSSILQHPVVKHNDIAGLTRSNAKTVTVPEVFSVVRLNVRPQSVDWKQRKAWKHLDDIVIPDNNGKAVELLLGANVLEAMLQQESSEDGLRADDEDGRTAEDLPPALPPRPLRLPPRDMGPQPPQPDDMPPPEALGAQRWSAQPPPSAGPQCWSAVPL